MTSKDQDVSVGIEVEEIDIPEFSTGGDRMRTEAILGPSGCGKSTMLRERIEHDPNYALLTSSTGISAVNLGPGVTTIHSALGFYDIRSLEQSVKQGSIVSKIYDLAVKARKNLVLDEISMFSADHLQLIHEAFVKANEQLREDNENPIGLVLVGDHCQLPPIPDNPKGEVRYAFEAPCWEQYEANMTRLTKIWRQDSAEFTDALNVARAGRGVDAAIALKKCGVEFVKTDDEKFDGITLFAVNQQVENYNERRLEALPGKVIDVRSERWGRHRSEWKQIPESLILKPGALVMILVNQPRDFKYVNGDLATFNELDSIGDALVDTKRGFSGTIPKTIRRNLSFSNEDSLEAEYLKSEWGKVLGLPPVVPKCNCPSDFGSGSPGDDITCDCGKSYFWWPSKAKWTLKSSPWLEWIATYKNYIEAHTMRGARYYDPRSRGTVVGEVEYMPLRLAYGSSYHKTQGLTLDKVQINIGHFWAGKPGMLYVALSRCRTPEGLRIIGDVALLSKKIKTDQRVMRWV